GPPVEAGPPLPSVCVYNSDCTSVGAGLVCRSGRCVEECKADVDCPAGASCDPGTHRCIAPVPPRPEAGTGSRTDAGASPECVYNSDCTGGLVCRSGRCVEECKLNIDCQAGFICDSVSHRCTLPVATVPDGAPPQYGTTCNVPSDCPNP